MPLSFLFLRFLFRIESCQVLGLKVTIQNEAERSQNRNEQGE